MQKLFLYFYLFVLSFYGAEIKGIKNGLYDTYELMVFYSLLFLVISLIEFLKYKYKEINIRNSESFLFLFLLWSAGTFYISINADLSFSPAMKCLGAIAFGLALLIYLKDSEKLNKIWQLSFIFAGIHAVSGIIQKFFPYFLPEYPIEFLNSRSIFLTANYFSCFLIIHIPIGLYLFINEKIKFTKILVGISWISILIALGFSNSLAAQLIAGMQLFSIVIYFGILKNFKIVKLVSWASIVAIIIYLGLLQLVADFKPHSVFTSIQPKILTSNQVSISWYDEHVLPRIVYAWGGWKIFTENWLAGGGLWTYRELYPFTGLAEAYQSQRFIVKSPQHAHSFYSQIAGETGIIGLILLSGNIFYLFWNSFKKLNNEKTKNLNFPFFLLISISGYLIHNIGEYNWLNSHFVYYYVLLTVSMGYFERESHIETQNSIVSTNKSGPLSSKILPISIVFFIVFTGFTLSKYYQYNQIILKKVLESESLDEIEQQLSLSKRLCKRCGMPHYLSGFANFTEGKRLQDPELINKAQKEFGEVIKRNPYNSKVYMFRGDIFRWQGKNQNAKESYQMALRDSRYKEIAHKKIANLEKLN